MKLSYSICIPNPCTLSPQSQIYFWYYYMEQLHSEEGIYGGGEELRF